MNQNSGWQKMTCAGDMVNIFKWKKHESTTKIRRLTVLELIGVIGSVASIIGLASFFLPSVNSSNTQSASIEQDVQGGTGVVQTVTGDIHIGITPEQFDRSFKRLEKKLLERNRQELKKGKKDILSTQVTNIPTHKETTTTTYSNGLSETGFADDISRSIEVISVFEEQDFNLCGYKAFSAKVEKTGDGRPAIKIYSMDGNIPDRPFRGFERIVHTEKMIELWPDCRVVFDYENLASTNRIVVSYIEISK